MFCSRCGTQVPDGFAGCPQCGAPMPGAFPPQAPVYVAAPVVVRPADESPKTKTVILLLWLFLSPFGIHRFYLGHAGLGICQLLFGWATCYIWNFVDGIVLIAGEPRDAQGLVVRRW